MSLEFLDTNVLVYAQDGGAGEKHSAAIGLIRRLDEQALGALSLQVLAEFFAVATRKLPVSAERAEQTLSAYAGWTIHRPDYAALLRASQLYRRYKIQWWDAMIVNSAIELGCSTLWTEDLRHGQKIRGVTVRNPFA